MSWSLLVSFGLICPTWCPAYIYPSPKPSSCLCLSWLSSWLSVCCSVPVWCFCLYCCVFFFFSFLPVLPKLKTGTKSWPNLIFIERLTSIVPVVPSLQICMNSFSKRRFLPHCRFLYIDVELLCSKSQRWRSEPWLNHIKSTSEHSTLWQRREKKKKKKKKWQITFSLCVSENVTWFSLS